MRRGKGWHGDSQGHAKAGAKGGKTTAQTYGEGFYKKIGEAGGKKVRELYGSEHFHLIGKIGGRNKKKTKIN